MRRTNSIAAWSRPRHESHDAGESWSLCAVCSIIPSATVDAWHGRFVPAHDPLHPTDPGECVGISAAGVYRTDDAAGPAATGASASRSSERFPSSGNACKIVRHPDRRIACSCKTTGVSIGPMTAPIPGPTSPTVCRQILASPWRLIRTIPTAFTSSPWNRMNFAALPRGACASIARGALGLPGNR